MRDSFLSLRVLATCSGDQSLMTNKSQTISHNQTRYVSPE